MALLMAQGERAAPVRGAGDGVLDSAPVQRRAGRVRKTGKGAADSAPDKLWKPSSKATKAAETLSPAQGREPLFSQREAPPRAPREGHKRPIQAQTHPNQTTRIKPPKPNARPPKHTSGRAHAGNAAEGRRTRRAVRSGRANNRSGRANNRSGPACAAPPARTPPPPRRWDKCCM